MKIFSKDLIFNIPKEQNDDYEKKLIRLNVERSLIMTWLILLIEIVILSLTFIPSIRTAYGSYLFTYRFLYIATICYTSFYLILNYLKQQYLKENTRLTRSFLVFSSLIFLTYSAAITLVDQSRQIESFVYLFICMAIAIIFISKPIDALFFFFISWLFYVIGNIVLGIEGTQLFSNLLNTTTVVITAFVISVTLHNNHARSYLKNVIIKEQKLELERIVLRDPMTGLYNRRGLNEVLHRIYQKAQTNNENMGVFMLDIDYFKGLNDTYGHDKGDEVLTKIADELLKIAAANNGAACRYGGDEMCLVIAPITNEEGLQLKNDIYQSILHLKIQNSASLMSEFITVSCGYAINDALLLQDPWALITAADKSLYKIKKKRGTGV
jgi:diguanylate cyclase (GGDEF)-like protein